MAPKKHIKKSKKTVTKAASSADILGGGAVKRVVSQDTNDICFVCDKRITLERITALKSLKTPTNRWTHAKCSPTTKVKGIYTGEVGTSKLLVVDKLYNDSVRSVFRGADNESSESNEAGSGDEED